MAGQYAILRAKPAFHAAEPFSMHVGPTARASDVSGMDDRVAAGAASAVKRAELNDNEVLDTARVQSMQGIAQITPIALTRPIEVEAQASAAPPWGIEAVRADASAFTGAGVIVAMLATGIDRTHHAFDGATLIEKDFTTVGNGGLHGHGTDCASTRMARPHAAGVVALWWQSVWTQSGFANPGLVTARLASAAQPGAFLPTVAAADRDAGLLTAP